MNGIAQITIAGREVGIKFGLPAIKRLYERVSTLDLITNDKYNELGIIHMLYAGYMNYCLMKDATPEIAFDAFYEYVESAVENPGRIEEITNAIRAFEESRYIRPKLQEQKQQIEGSKKKELNLTGMQSNHSALENYE